MSGLAQKVKEIVAETMRVDPRDVHHDATFVEDLEGDGLDLVLVACECEKVFDIEIDNGDIDAVKTFGDLVEVVEKAVAK